MAETNSLLNCRTREGTGGSNPPSSANFARLFLKRDSLVFSPKSPRLFSLISFIRSPDVFPAGRPVISYLIHFRRAFLGFNFPIKKSRHSAQNFRRKDNNIPIFNLGVSKVIESCPVYASLSYKHICTVGFWTKLFEMKCVVPQANTII